jgi:integral membrane protein (TIGR00529 family)
MPDILKISLVFVLILLLLRKKLNIGYVMLAASALMFLLYRMSFDSILNTFKNAFLSSVTIKLILALSFIRMFELILREHDVLTRMMSSVKAIFRNRRIVIISMPLLIGLIPSVGGAYFSAPMVAETTGDLKMSQEEKGFVNYWFRHPWEYILPLYPGVLLASAISKTELHALISANLPCAGLILITGFLFSMHCVRGTVKIEEGLSRKGLWSFVPIIVILLLVVTFRIELHYALITVVAFLFVFYRYSLKSTVAAFRHGFSPDVIVLIIGVMVFKEAMEYSGAVGNLSRLFIEQGIPTAPILFLLPFVTGILTGLTVGFVGSTFPLLLSLAGNISPADISFAFASGFLGVLLSPVHICLVLTREYFRADLWGIYKFMLPGCAIIFCGAVAQYLILR